jgi:histidine ammonia-lyase
MYIHSIPNNNDNQDIVSMGTNAAVITAKVIENSFEVLAIELITIVQAIDCLEQKDKISSVTKKIYDDVRKIIPTFKEDQVMYPFVQKVKDYLINN